MRLTPQDRFLGDAGVTPNPCLGPLATGILTGVVVIENIFGIPGLDKEFIDSILNRDYNIVIGVFTFYAALVGLVNLGVDLLYPVLDPRIRY